MKAKSYVVLTRALEEGVRFGLNRWTKHMEEPPSEESLGTLEAALCHELTSAVCEVFTFGKEDDE